MQLECSFSTLLASLLLVLVYTNGADARPTRRDVGLVTMPLKRVPQSANVHSQVVCIQFLLPSLLQGSLYDIQIS